MNIRSAIILGAKILNGKLIKTAYLDSEILMACAINKDRKFVILNPNENIKKEYFSKFKKLVKNRSSRKPIAHLIKKNSFGTQSSL